MRTKIVEKSIGQSERNGEEWPTYNPSQPTVRQKPQTAPERESAATVAGSQEEAIRGNEGASGAPRRSGRAKLPVERYAPEQGSRELAAEDGDSVEEVMRMPPLKSPTTRPRKLPQGLSLIKHLTLTLTPTEPALLWSTEGSSRSLGLRDWHSMAEFSRMSR